MKVTTDIEYYLQVGDMEIRANDIEEYVKEHNNMKKEIERLKRHIEAINRWIDSNIEAGNIYCYDTTPFPKLEGKK